MKMKNNFCDGRQYEMWKSRDGGGNNAYKIFTSYSEEGNIPNTMHYVELLMTIMKMKNNFCNGDKYEMRKSRDRLGSNAYKIFTSWVEDGKGREMWKCWNGGGNNAYNIFMCQVEEGYIPNTIIYVKQFMTPMISTMDTSMICEKAKMGKGIMLIKTLRAKWRREILYTNNISCLKLFNEKEAIL